MASLPSFAVLRHRAYRRYLAARVCASCATQMTAVAIGWQVYDIARATRPIEQSALILGLVGLVQFLPLLALSLVGGMVADRFDRKLTMAACLSGRVAATLALVAASLAPVPALAPFFLAAATLGGLNAFIPAASNALFPRLVPRADLPQAIAWNSLMFQGAAIVGPAIGGALFVAGPEFVFGTAAALSMLAATLIVTIAAPRQEPMPDARGLAMIAEGLRYVRDNSIVFGAISLDLVVVLFGGATALLPVFARDILHAGPEGLGLLRAAPAVGAACVAFGLAGRALARRVGAWMLGAVAAFGAAMLLFAASKFFWLSAVALAATGAADMFSVYVRQSLIQLATPDALRGRVTAVSFIFISASNELGEFESGVAARFLGPIGAVVLGGGVAIGAAGIWPRLFPALRRVDRFEDAAIEEKVV